MTIQPYFSNSNWKILKGKIKYIIRYQNDVYVGALTKEEFKYQTEQIFKKLNEAGKDKCELNCAIYDIKYQRIKFHLVRK